MKSAGATAITVIALLTATTVSGSMIPQAKSFRKHGYEHIADEQGVAVYKDKHAEIIRLGADGIIRASTERVLEALLAYEAQLYRMERLAETRVLERGEGWLLVYQRLSLPVISDRDFVLRVTWGTDGPRRWIRYRAVRGKGPPPRGGVVRVTHHEGTWQLSPIRGGEATLVRFQVTIDLGGWLPRSLARSGAGDEVPELFQALRAMVRHGWSDARAGK